MKKLFLILSLITITVRILGQETLKRQIDYLGCTTAFIEYKNEIAESYYLTRTWVFIDKKSDTPEKIRLKEFCRTGENRLDEMLKLYGYLLDTVDIVKLLKVKEDVEKLIEKQKYIMNALRSFESYDDPLIVFDVIPPVEYGGTVEKLKDTIILELDKLIQKIQLEYVDYIGRLNTNQSSAEPLKTKKIKQLLDLMNVSAEVKELLTISNKSGLSRNYLEKDIYEILLQKYDKYYTIGEIDDLIAFYKTKTGKKVVKVSKKMLVETLSEIVNSLK